MNSPKWVLSSFNRSNLKYEVQTKKVSVKKINRLPAVLWIRIQITEIRSVVCSFGDQDSQRLKKDTLEASKNEDKNSQLSDSIDKKIW